MKTVITVALFLIVITAFAAKSGEDFFYSKCTKCHGSSLSLNKQKSKQGWIQTIKRMKKHGMSISSSETKSIADFLSGGK